VGDSFVRDFGGDGVSQLCCNVNRALGCVGEAAAAMVKPAPRSSSRTSYVSWLERNGWTVSREVESVDISAERGQDNLYAEAEGRTAIRLDVDTPTASS
jgi:hypothetical protein